MSKQKGDIAYGMYAIICLIDKYPKIAMSQLALDSFKENLRKHMEDFGVGDADEIH